MSSNFEISDSSVEYDDSTSSNQIPSTTETQQQESSENSPVPKIIHQIWYQGEDHLPIKYHDWQESWKRHNPEYKYILWSEDMMRKVLELDRYKWFLRTWNLYPKMIQRIDTFKWIALDLYGGYYVDMDMECLRSLDTLWKEHRKRSPILGTSNDNNKRTTGKEESTSTDSVNDGTMTSWTPFQDNEAITDTTTSSKRRRKRVREPLRFPYFAVNYGTNNKDDKDNLDHFPPRRSILRKITPDPLTGKLSKEKQKTNSVHKPFFAIGEFKPFYKSWAKVIGMRLIANNAFIASTPKHPFLMVFLKECRDRLDTLRNNGSKEEEAIIKRTSSIAKTTGPLMVSILIGKSQEAMNIQVVDSSLVEVYPFESAKYGKTGYIVHNSECTWANKGSLFHLFDATKTDPSISIPLMVTLIIIGLILVSVLVYAIVKMQQLRRKEEQ